MTANPTRFKASKTLAIRGASIDDSADIPTPWGLDAFRRKRIRDD